MMRLFNREGVLQVLKLLKSKFLIKNHMPLRAVFTETVTNLFCALTLLCISSAGQY